jgi:ATP-dependent DNA helicase RecG
MSLQQVEQLLQRREGLRLEFKEARLNLPRNLFETICAMLNRDGGDILLGVADDGTLTGVDPSRAEGMKTNLVNLSNNPQKLEPPFILFPLVYQVRGETIIHIQVPASSQVHKSASVVYDRSNDGDFRVTQPHRIAELSNRKRTHYTEGIIYPALRFEHFKPELFPKIRNLIRSNNPNHPWLALDDEQMLKMAGLWKQDFESSREGYTLAAALLLGKDEVIGQILPHYKIDALVRKENMARYDDRDYINTNLVEAYERLMDFVAKHLPDKFHLEGDQRVSLRAKIFREVVANLIVHREYTNAHPATFIIYKDRVQTDNGNNPHGDGPIRPDDFSPLPKNPSIAKFFIQLGRVDELGSGVLNVYRYLVYYTPGKTPQFIEGNTFRMIVPLGEQAEAGNTSSAADYMRAIRASLDEVASNAVKDRLIEIGRIIVNTPGIKLKGIQENVNVSRETIKKDLKVLIDNGLVEYRGSLKTGGYYALLS